MWLIKVALPSASAESSGRYAALARWPPDRDLTATACNAPAPAPSSRLAQGPVPTVHSTPAQGPHWR